MTATPPPGITRRRVLAGAVLAVPWLAGCSLGGPPPPPDPLIALVDAARADAALATAAIAAAPELADRVLPLVDARNAHAVELDAEVARLDPDRAASATTAPPTPAPTGGSGASAGDPLAQVRGAVLASATAAAELALQLPAERVGLVASVAACCATYAAVLG